MRKCLLVLCASCSLIVNAQSSEGVVTAGSANEIKPGMMLNSNDTATELYHTYANFPERNIIMAYVGEGNEPRRFALLEYKSKKKITPFIFESVFSFYKNDLSQVKVNSKYGVINSKGQVIVPWVYDNMETILVNEATNYIVSKAGRFGILNSANEIVIPFEYDKIEASYRARGFVSLTKNGKSGFMNMATRKLVIPSIYDQVYMVSADIIQVKKDSVYCLFKMDGEQLFANWYTRLEVSRDREVVLVNFNGKKGFVNMAEKATVPLIYDELNQIYGNFSSGSLFIAIKDGKQGVIRADGKLHIPVIYNQIKYLTDYKVVVTKGNKKGLFTDTGKQIIPIEYDALTNADGDGFGNTIIAVKNGKYGMVDINGNSQIPCTYDKLQYLNSFLAIAVKNGKYGVVERNNSNKVVLPFIYRFITNKDETILAYRSGLELFKISGNKITKSDN